LNNFYASVECLLNPSIKDKPVAVCGSQKERHGIVLAKNSIAKKYGVKTGEATWEAKKKCAGIITVPPNFEKYIEISKNVREVYSRYTDLIEPFGIDENWLDVTNSSTFGDGEKIADEIKYKIKNELGITVSVGVSYNKIFSKLASDIANPDSLFSITEENYKRLIWNLPVDELLYVGRQTRKKLCKIGIHTIGALAMVNVNILKSILGKWGEILWIFANGLDNSSVTKREYEFPIKGIGNSLTSPHDIKNIDEAKVMIFLLTENVTQRLRKHNLKTKTVQIYIRDTDLNSVERQGQLLKPSFITNFIADKAIELFIRHWNWEKSIRSMGIRVSSLSKADKYTQLSFLPDLEQKLEPIERCMDKINSKFGRKSIHRAILLQDKKIFNSPFEANQIYPLSYFR
jgi:DNA polymerase-4